MSEIEQLLERQALWQQSRRSLSWPEKFRMAKQIRESVALLRLTAAPNAANSSESKTS